MPKSTQPMKDTCSRGPISCTRLLGNPHMVSPPPPSDTPPPTSMPIHSNLSTKPSTVLMELQKTAKETTRKRLKTHLSPWKFEKRICPTATQKSTPLSQTKIINPFQSESFRSNRIRAIIRNSVSVLSRIRICCTAINFWIGKLSRRTCGCKLFRVHGKSIIHDDTRLHGCLSSISTQLCAVSRRDSMLKGIGDIMGIKEKESWGKKVKAAGAIMDGTKTEFCQDKAGSKINNILRKVFLGRGVAYLLCFINKFFKIISISPAVVKFNSFGCFEYVHLVSMSISYVVRPGCLFVFFSRILIKSSSLTKDSLVCQLVVFFPSVFLDKFVSSTKDSLESAEHQQPETSMQVSHQQQRKVLTEGKYMIHTPQHGSNSYQSATQPSSTPSDHFKAQTLKYPSNFRLFLWIVIEEGFITFTLWIYHHHTINNLASYNCCALHQLWVHTPERRYNQHYDETMHVTRVKTRIKNRRFIHAIKEMRFRTRRSEVNAYNWELVMLSVCYPIVKSGNTIFPDYVTLDNSNL